MLDNIKERPILFSGPMVRALLAGTKTQTRRATGLDFVNENPGCWQVQWVPDKDGKHWLFTCGDDRVQVRCPYGVEGDRLVVGEAWRTLDLYDSLKPSELAANSPIYFEADNAYTGRVDEDYFRQHLGRYRHARFLPKHLRRILLEIVSVRVERLKSISEADARAEGYGGFMDFYDLLSNDDKREFDLMEEDVDDYAKLHGINYPIEWYHMLWDKINGTNAWHDNPWVWVVEFKRVVGKEVSNA